jgi:hypothetical protein
MPTPPVKPVVPSTISSLRWLRYWRRRTAYGFGGRKKQTFTPASRILRTSLRSICAAPTASTITLHSTPAVAFSQSVSATSVAISPRQ